MIRTETFEELAKSGMFTLALNELKMLLLNENIELPSEPDPTSPELSNEDKVRSERLVAVAKFNERVLATVRTIRVYNNYPAGSSEHTESKRALSEFYYKSLWTYQSLIEKYDRFLNRDPAKDSPGFLPKEPTRNLVLESLLRIEVLLERMISMKG